MQAARDRQKSYADKRRRPLEFEVGDKVMLKVAPWKGVMRFRKRGKLNPRYIGPFRIIERIGPVAYRLELPQELSRVHNVFHVCNLKKCLSDDTLVIPLEEIQLDDKLNFVEEPVEIMDREVKQLKRSRIPIIKVRWNARRGPEYTWEREDQFKSKYPHLFENPPDPTTEQSCCSWDSNPPRPFLHLSHICTQAQSAAATVAAACASVRQRLAATVDACICGDRQALRLIDKVCDKVIVESVDVVNTAEETRSMVEEVTALTIPVSAATTITTSTAITDVEITLA
ncbi:hypothetical protein Tco_0204321 [Tanacetum coccineum]